MMIFGTSKQLFAKNNLIPGEKENRNVYSRVCRNKTGNCCGSVFFFVSQCNFSSRNRINSEIPPILNKCVSKTFEGNIFCFLKI